MSSPIKISDTGESYIPLKVPSRLGVNEEGDLRLTPWKEDDLDDLIELFNLPNIENWGRGRPSPFTRSDAEDLIPEIQSHLSFNLSPSLSTYPKTRVRLSPLGAVRTEQGKVIGTMGVKPPLKPESEWEVTYNVHDDYAGRGIGNAMVGVAVDLARWLGIERLIAHTERGNLASNHILRKNGFVIQAEIMVEWPEHRGGGQKEAYEWVIDL
ncbi:uncharacterized protein L199_002399 [Kwoniella botswanensis]|uniref:uncharacterized protein n=1 Tax=Kwoniella botswanensis TaxID=1268659 RepID=UPI00315DEFD5